MGKSDRPLLLLLLLLEFAAEELEGLMGELKDTDDNSRFSSVVRSGAEAARAVEDDDGSAAKGDKSDGERCCFEPVLGSSQRSDATAEASVRRSWS